MPPFSPVPDWAAELVRLALRWAPGTPLRLAPVPGLHRNRSYRVHGPATVFLKLAPDAADRHAFQREAAALTALEGMELAVRLLAHGEAEDGHPAWIITAAALGIPLSQMLDATLESVIPMLEELRDILYRLRACMQLTVIQSALEDRLSGSWAPDFRPADWLRKHNHPFAEFVSGLKAPQVTSLHGSLDPGNVLARCDGLGPQLSRLLDFEGSRRGPLGLDEATFWYKLMLAGRSDIAEAWCRLVLDNEGAALRPGFISSAAWLSAFRCAHSHPEREADIGISAEVSRHLVELHEETSPQKISEFNSAMFRQLP